MTTQRTYMTALCGFNLGSEAIDEGDLLKLTQAEAEELMARGFIAPADIDRKTPSAQPTTLSDTDLAEMAADLQRWSSNPTHTDAFRRQCDLAANLIAQHLAGADNAAEAGAVLEALYDGAAPAEIARITRMEAQQQAVDEAFGQSDFATWREEFKALLDNLSESHLQIMAEHFAHLDPAPDVVLVDTALVDTALVHDMPAAVQ